MTLEEFWRGIKRTKEPLVGLKYIMHIVDSPNNFACMLCISHVTASPKRGNWFNLIQHVKSRPHQKRFFEVEYPTVYEKFLRFQQDPETFEDDISYILNVLAKSVSEKAAQLEVTDSSNFKNKRCEIFHKIQNYRPPVKTYEVKLLHDQLDECIKSIVAGNFIAQHAMFRNLENNKKPVQKSENVGVEVGTGPVQIKEEPSEAVEVHNNAIEEYGRLYEEETEKIKIQYSFYKQQPDSHPNFKLEYYHFYCTRHADNRLENIEDDFKALWLTKLDKMKQDEILKVKISIRKKLQMPIDEGDLTKLNALELLAKEKKLFSDNYFKKLAIEEAKKSAQAVNGNLNQKEDKIEFKIKEEELETIHSNLSADTIVGDTGCETPDSDDLNMSLETIPEIENSPPNPVKSPESEFREQKSSTPQNYANLRKPPVKRVIVDPNELFEEFNKKHCLSNSSSNFENQYTSSSSTSVSTCSNNEANDTDDTDDKIDGLTFKQILFIYDNVDKMSAKDRFSFHEKMVRLKTDYPAKYQRLVRMHDEAKKKHQNVTLNTQEDDDYDINELAKYLKDKTQKINQVSFDTPPEEVKEEEDFFSTPMQVTGDCWAQVTIKEENDIIDLTSD